MRASLVVLSLLVLSVGWSSAARADLAPRDGCTMPGQPCQNAGPLYDQRGVCAPATCTKQLPTWDAPMSYACNLCQVTDAGVSAGTGGAGGAAGAQGTAGASGASGAPGTGGVTATGGSSSHNAGSSSGCAVAPGTTGGEGAEILVVLVAAGLAVARRRRNASR